MWRLYLLWRGQELGQFWAKLNVGNAKLQKTSSNTSITDGNGNYSIAGATYGIFSDKDCTKQLATLTTDENGNTDIAEIKAGTVYIKELSAPAGYKVDKTIYPLTIKAGETATLNVSDTPKVTDTLIELFKIDMETQKDNPQGNASLAGAEFTWKYYAGFYNKDNLPAEATRTWVTKTIAETDSDGTTHYITKLADTYKVSGDNFYMQDGKAVLPLGTSEPDDSKGALPYDTYIIEEMRCESNKGFELIPPFEIVVSRNNLVIDLGTLTDKYEKEISIHTTATSKDDEKTILAGKEVTIVDTVKLDGLKKGTKYQLKGCQMLKEENAELLINGKRVESDYTFIADSETMKVEVAFTFDATSLDGKQLVTFEELYDLSNPDEPKKVTEHKDIEDKGQTITFKEKPEEPEKPETPPTPEKSNRPSDSPKTGDSTNVMAFIVMLLASAGGLAGTYLYKRRKMKKS